MKESIVAQHICDFVACPERHTYKNYILAEVLGCQYLWVSVELISMVWIGICTVLESNLHNASWSTRIIAWPKVQ